jgi:hypothetical protein
VSHHRLRRGINLSRSHDGRDSRWREGAAIALDHKRGVTDCWGFARAMIAR